MTKFTTSKLYITLITTAVLSFPALAQEPSEYDVNFETPLFSMQTENGDVNAQDVYLGSIENMPARDRRYMLRTNARQLRGLKIKGANVYITRFQIQFANGNISEVQEFRGHIGSVGRFESRRETFNQRRNVTRVIVWGHTTNRNRSSSLQIWGL